MPHALLGPVEGQLVFSHTHSSPTPGQARLGVVGTVRGWGSAWSLPVVIPGWGSGHTCPLEQHQPTGEASVPLCGKLETGRAAPASSMRIRADVHTAPLPCCPHRMTLSPGLGMGTAQPSRPARGGSGPHHLPGWVSQDVPAVEGEDTGPRPQLAAGAREQGLPAGEQLLVLCGHSRAVRP